MQDGQSTNKEKVIYKPNPKVKNKRNKLCFLDIETVPGTDNQQVERIKFINHLGDVRTFFKIADYWEEMKKFIYRGCWVFAHNLGFDFIGLMTGGIKSFYKCISKSGGIMFAVTYVVNGVFVAHPRVELRNHKITMVDTLNYAQQSLKAIGETVGLEKLEWDFDAGLPQDTEEFDLYATRDVEILQKFVHLLNDVTFELGGRLQTTLASTAENIFRRGYLEGCYIQMPEDTMQFIFKAFFGGTCQTFKAGIVEDCRYYDQNSKYPFFMLRELPDPNTFDDIKKGDIFHILTFEGVSTVTISYPYTDKPFLPVKLDCGKTVNPYGDSITGTWTHYEIRRVLQDGAKIIDIGRCVYFTGKCRPYDKFVKDMYARRMKAKEAGQDSLAYIYKIIMNSLFGKAGQKFGQEEYTIYHKDDIDYEFLKTKDFKEVGSYFYVREERKARSFCIPIWPVYITAMGRIDMIEMCRQYDAIATDTDSIITKAFIPTGKELGEWKLEKLITKAYFVRPKMYAIDCSDELITGPKTKKDIEHNKKIHKKEVKCKGFPGMSSFKDFEKALLDQKKDDKTGKIIITLGKSKKFVKFKESIRRGIPGNSVLIVEKFFSLDDDKRLWPGKFDMNILMDSKPHRLIEGKTEKDFNIENQKYALKRQKEFKSFNDAIDGVDSDENNEE